MDVKKLPIQKYETYGKRQKIDTFHQRVSSRTTIVYIISSGYYNRDIIIEGLEVSFPGPIAKLRSALVTSN